VILRGSGRVGVCGSALRRECARKLTDAYFAGSAKGPEREVRRKLRSDNRGCAGRGV
jgi:hypothetical protein